MPPCVLLWYGVEAFQQVFSLWREVYIHSIWIITATCFFRQLDYFSRVHCCCWQDPANPTTHNISVYSSGSITIVPAIPSVTTASISAFDEFRQAMTVNRDLIWHCEQHHQLPSPHTEHSIHLLNDQISNIPMKHSLGLTYSQRLICDPIWACRCGTCLESHTPAAQRAQHS